MLNGAKENGVPCRVEVKDMVVFFFFHPSFPIPGGRWEYERQILEDGETPFFFPFLFFSSLVVDGRFLVVGTNHRVPPVYGIDGWDSCSLGGC